MKKTFIMYNDWIDMIMELDEKSQSELLRAVMCYQNGMDLPEMGEGARVAFAQMRKQFRADNEKYEETVQKRSMAGKASAQAKANKSQQVLTHVESVEHTSTNSTDTVNDNDTDNVNENVNVNDNVLLKDEKQKKESTLTSTKERFKPPTVEEVKEYAAERGMAIDAEHFVDFYASKGWMVGKNKMKDWKACVRNWARQDRQGTAAKPSGYMDAIANRVKVVDEW